MQASSTPPSLAWSCLLHINMRLPRLLVAPAIAIAVVIGVVATGLLGSGGANWASAQGAPPNPPTFIPTPIGSPPPPPTLTPTPTPRATATKAASGSPTATAAATSTPTKGPAQEADFTLDAVRLSRVNNPGNLEGLAAVKPGTRVWLMMYYTVRSMPGPMKRTTSYSIMYSGKTLFRVKYSSTAKPAELGRYSRYSVYVLPRTLPFGRYMFKASLSFGPTAATKLWKFAVAKQELVSSTSGSG